MEQNEKIFIHQILARLKENMFSYFSSSEYQNLDVDYKEKWLIQKSASSKICNLCFGEHCRIDFEEGDTFLPCPHGIPEVIEITETDRFTYHFNLNEFFNQIKKDMQLKEDIVPFKHFSILGQTEYKQSGWKVVFTFGRKLERSLGDLIELQLKHNTTFTLILVDEKPHLDEFQLSIFENLGIHLSDWKEYNTPIIEHIYQNKRAQWEVRKEIESLPIDDAKKMLLTTLERAATSSDGDWFEDEVYKVLRKISPHVIPFGAQYKGFSIPDGMIFGNNKPPFPTIFYDCKSSAHDDYAIKPAVAMQVNYYMDFLNHFHNEPEKYKSCGFAIFADAFDDTAQKRISGSPQWKLVQEKCKLFYVDRRCLERIENVISEHELQGHFDSIDVFNICFGEDISIIDDSQTQKTYEQLFPASAFNQFRYMKPEQFEVAIVAAVINKSFKINMVSSTRDDIKEALRKAKHDNIRRGIKRPILFSLLSRFIDLAKEDKYMTQFHPLTTLLIINRKESDLMEALGEDLVNEIAQIAEKRIEELLEQKASTK